MVPIAVHDIRIVFTVFEATQGHPVHSIRVHAQNGAANPLRRQRGRPR